MVVVLKDWSERFGQHHTANGVIKEIEALGHGFRGMTTRAYNQPPIRGLSTTGGVEFYVEDRVVGNAAQLESVCNQLIKRSTKHREIARAYQTLNTHSLQVAILPDIDRDKFYGVNLKNYFDALQTMYSNDNVNFAYIMQDLAWVVLEADFPFRASLNNLDNVYVKSTNGSMVPLAAISTVKMNNAAQVVQRFNGYLASKITVNPATGYSMVDAMNIINSEVANLPKGYAYDWFGTSFAAQQSQQTSVLAFTFSILMIYLVLAALYEMWRLPIVILLGVPSALFGAAIILLLSGTLG
jgi:multidrug efflux pump